MQGISHLKKKSSSSNRGFALVVSLSLMSFVLLLILSIATMTRVETSASSSSRNKLQAQQQAMLGLQIAIGELQKSTGPDQRVSAPANLLTGTSTSRSNLIGVWSAEDQNQNIPPQDRLLNWLTSDARNSNGTLTSDYNTAEMPGEGDSNAIVLVGANSLTAPTDTSSIPNGKKVILNTTNTRTLGLNDEETGRYAWWVGDEGIKATINRTRDEVPELERAVLEISSPSIARFDVLDGLSEINFFKSEEIRNLTNLDSLALLDGGSIGVGNPYFHDLTTHSAGLMVDVKNGGFKKDLSLAFEMDDAEFNDSEFGSDGANTINAPGFGKVQPIFTIETNDAHGPVWHLLRDYYRLYHLIDDPLGNPKLDARVFGPNLNHSRINLSDNALNDSAVTIDWQPAIAMAGGKAKLQPHTFGKPDGQALISDDNGLEEGRSETQKLEHSVVNIAMFADDPIRQMDGDPLRGNGTMPIMMAANYMPYMMRYVSETGVWFGSKNTKKLGPDAPKKMSTLNIASRERFIMHNPYNVTLVHDDMAIDAFGGELGFHLFNNDNAQIRFKEIKNNILENAKDGTWMQVSRRKLRMEANELKPGQIITYQASDYGNSSYSTIGTDPTWHHFKTGNKDGNDSWLFEPPADDANALTLAVFGSDITNIMRTGSTGGQNEVSFSTLFFSTHLREGNEQRNDKTIEHRWPMASVIDTVVVLPGAKFDGTEKPSGLASFYPEATTADKFYPTYLANEVNTFSITPADLDTYSSQNNPKPMLTIDVQLKPAEYDRSNTRYPAFTRSNPLAPVKDSKNLLPLDDLYDDADTLHNGFPKVSPDIAVDYTNSSTMGLTAALDTWGPTDGLIKGVDAPVLIELPTSPVLSIGKLQHANLSVHAHMPALAVGNSLASVYIRPTETYETYKNLYGQPRVFYDLSYLMNEALWDSYFFSSLSVPYSNTNNYSPTGGKVVETFRSGITSSLPNPRNKLYTNKGEDFASVEDKLFEGDDIKADAYNRVAENLICAGSFNVNSTSVDAWHAVLSGARDLAIYQSGQSTATSVPTGSTAFPRHSRPKESFWDTNESDAKKEAWEGFRSLSNDDIKQLAESIVAELKDRSNNQGHPYISLGDFVNRELVNTENGRCGLLQAAINRAQLNAPFLDNSYASMDESSLSAPETGVFKAPNNIFESGTSAASASMSAPTYLMQADLLQAIGSFINVRSDTFKIRSYGDSRDPITGEVLARVWYEAILQRTPEPVKPNTTYTPADSKYWNVNRTENPFGRRYKIISIRQLPEDEV